MASDMVDPIHWSHPPPLLAAISQSPYHSTLKPHHPYILSTTMETSHSPVYLVIRDQIFWAFVGDSIETVCIRKYVAEYEQMWKWILSKFQGHGMKIARVNLIRVAKPLIFSIYYVPLLDKWRHHEPSSSLLWTCIDLALVYIPCSKLTN